jgi:hypothetical protein
MSTPPDSHLRHDAQIVHKLAQQTLKRNESPHELLSVLDRQREVRNVIKQ